MTTLQFNNSLLSLQDKLRYFALSLTSNDEDASDLLQETTLKALMYRSQFVNNSNFKAWMFTIMKNTFINNYRRNQKSRNTFDGSEDALRVANKQNYESETPEEIHRVHELNLTIDRLDEDFRVPFKMHTEGFKYKEIAEKTRLAYWDCKKPDLFHPKKLQQMLDD